MRDEDVRRRFDLLEPGWPIFERAAKQGAIAATLTLVLIAVVFWHADRWEWPLAALPLATGFAWGVKVVRSFRHILSPEQRARLESQRSLIARKDALSPPRAAAHADLDAVHRRMLELSALASRMKSIDPEVYSARIAVLERARALLMRNAALTQRLLDGYDRAAEMMDIEMDTLDVLVSLPEASGLELDSKMSELALIREQLVEQERVLAADAEVALLLSGSETA